MGDQPKNEIFQYSIVSALIDGIASYGLPVSALLKHGDHGLGTFGRMNGEMIILAGKIYQMKPDGEVKPIDIDTMNLPSGEATVDAKLKATGEATVEVVDKYVDITPFAMVTRFDPKMTFEAALPSKKALEGYLSYHLPQARNLYMAYRVKGTFRSVTVRTVGGQNYPGERLVDVADRQETKVLGYNKGELFGFRSPDYAQGISVAGDHLHFISEDKGCGGHVLDLATSGKVTLEVAPVSKFHLELPSGNPNFNRAQLKLDGAGIEKVEG